MVCDGRYCLICFINHQIKELNFRRKNKFKSTDVFNLDSAIAKFTLPRLKVFRKTTFSHPSELSPKRWEKILDDIIYAMEYKVNQWDEDSSEVDFERVKRGFRFFGKYFRDLWI